VVVCANPFTGVIEASSIHNAAGARCLPGGVRTSTRPLFWLERFDKFAQIEPEFQVAARKGSEGLKRPGLYDTSVNCHKIAMS
jgi:hypothetical protein